MMLLPYKVPSAAAKKGYGQRESFPLPCYPFCFILWGNVRVQDRILRSRLLSYCSGIVGLHGIIPEISCRPPSTSIVPNPQPKTSRPQTEDRPRTVFLMPSITAGYRRRRKCSLKWNRSACSFCRIDFRVDSSMQTPLQTHWNILPLALQQLQREDGRSSCDTDPEPTFRSSIC